MYILFENLTQKQADICSLVLSASGIPYRIARSRNRFDVWVSASGYDRALQAMELYFNENKNVSSEFKERSVGIHQSSVISGLIVVLMLLLSYIASQEAGTGQEVVNRFAASAVKILDGEYYRAVTALLMHQDEVHLLGNMVGIFIFGTAVCSVAGWGVGWLMVLVSGIAGNLLNALMYESGHVSIGASTAVFGAIGILAGYQGFKHKHRPSTIKRVLVPVACGVALLGLLGSGGGIHVDIMAHLFGFLWGLLFGSVYAVLVKKNPGNIFQWLSVACVLGIVFGAWASG